MLKPIISIYSFVEDERIDKAILDVAKKYDSIRILDKESDIPEKSLVILVSENVDELERYRDTDRFIYNVYVGDIKVLDFDRYSSIEIVATLENQKYLNRLFEGRVDFAIRDYESYLYKYLLQTVIDTSPDMVWFKDKEESHVILNKTFGEVVEKPVEYCLNKKHPDIWDIPWEDYESSDFACRKSESEIIKTGKMGVFEEAVLTHGRLKQFTTYKTPLYDYFGNVLGTCGIGHDVTNISDMGYELDILLSSIPFPVFICDLDYNVIRMNRAAAGITYKEEDEFLNYKEWSDIFLHKSNVSIGTEGNIYSFHNGVTDIYYSVATNSMPDYFGNKIGFLILLRDVTYQRMYMQMLSDAANTDVLTKVYNRRYFYDCIEKQKGHELTMLYADLDNFKAVNDELGHGKGDDVLRATATMLKRRFGNGKVFRLGGDEFAVMLDRDIEPDELTESIDAIQKDIEKLSAGCSKRVGISVGKIYSDALGDVEEFVRSGDTMMYEIKRQHHKI